MTPQDRQRVAQGVGWMVRGGAVAVAGAVLLLHVTPSAQPNALVHERLHHYVGHPEIRAVRSGAWSSADTWGGRVPEGRAKIGIPRGITVTVDRELSAPIDWIAVEGTLRFQPDAVTSLTAHTVAVLESGQFEMGTAGEPVTGRATLTLSSLGRDFDHATDPFELTLGLVVMGQARIHGRSKTAWVSMSAAPPAGATRLRTDRVPDGWQQGDRLVVTASTSGQEEDVTLQRVEGGEIVFSEPLRNTRVFPAAGLALHVGNLTRNVVIRSEPDDAGNPRRQAHVMLMSDPHAHEIRWAEFRDLGRTTIRPVTDPRILPDGSRDPSLCPPHISAENIRGRYALHFHHVGDLTAPARHHVQGVSIHVRKDSRFKFGLISHSSHVIVEDAVGYNIDGSTFMTEEGNEIGAFLRNLAVYSFGSNLANEDQPREIHLLNDCEPLAKRRRRDMGHNGSGFWAHSAGVDYVGNVAAGHSNAGFDFWTIPLSDPQEKPEAPPFLRFESQYLRPGSSWPGGGTAPLDWVPALFRDNVAYAAGFQRNGRKAGFALSHALHAGKAPSLGKSVIDGFVTWNVDQGVDSEYTSETIWRNLRVIAGARAPGTTGVGLRRQASENNNQIHNARISGFKTCYEIGDRGQSTDVQCEQAGNIRTTPPPTPGNLRVIR